MSLTIAFIMLSLSFFFSGMEIAFLSANRLKIELKTVQGDRSAKILSDFTKKTSEILITILIGNNLALVVFTMMIDGLTGPKLASMGITQETSFLLYTFLQAIIGTIIILVLAEYIPKAIFRQTSDRIVFPSAYILRFFYLILRAPVWLVNMISKVLLKIMFKVKTDDRVVVLGRKDLDQYIQEIIATSESVPVPDLDTDMLNNALSLKDTKARECMIPRTEIVAVPIDTSIADLIETFIETGLSKVIIYGESIDEVKGFIHTNSMFRKPESIEDSDLIQSVLVVPETMAANILLAELTENQRSVAIVVDEFGGTSGMVTMEDLVEEVFGEIEDEHDPPEAEEQEEDLIKEKNQDGTYLLGARNDIDDLNEEFGFDLPEEEYYTTLGGLILYVAEDIPEEGAVIEVENYLITIVKTAQNKIILVKLVEND
jgi:putative hemolysin